MARQTNSGRVASGRNSSAGAAVLDMPETEASSAQAGGRLQEEILRLVDASRAGRLDERGRTDRFEGGEPLVPR